METSLADCKGSKSLNVSRQTLRECWKGGDGDGQSVTAEKGVSKKEVSVFRIYGFR